MEDYEKGKGNMTDKSLRAAIEDNNLHVVYFWLVLFSVRRLMCCFRM